MARFKHMPFRRASTALAVASAVLALAAVPAAGESDLLLDFPTSIGTVPAATYDVTRKKVGDAHLVFERQEDGTIRLMSESGFTGGARTVVTALFEEVDGVGANATPKLRPLRQESRSFDPNHVPLGVLVVDNVAGEGRCYDGDGELQATVEIPDEDRVANATLSMLFLPLARGETDEIEFQLFFCSLGNRFVPFVATRAPSNGNSGKVIEVRYGPDLGFASIVAASFVPKLSFWFDAASPHRWLAHRLPLYGKGPEVFVVRQGVPTRWLGDE